MYETFQELSDLANSLVTLQEIWHLSEYTERTFNLPKPFGIFKLERIFVKFPKVGENLNLIFSICFLSATGMRLCPGE